MTVMRTDKWLLDLYDQPEKVCENLTDHFDDASASEIYQYLTFHGMYHPLKNGDEMIERLIKKRAWEVVYKEEKRLKKKWSGPSVPIYIFPSDITNSRINREFNGKSGIAFKDKLFLFISEKTTENELKALFTHEYNHVCRLVKYKRNEKDYTLMDTIMLEGLAENAVQEDYGEDSLAPYIKYYSDLELERFWQRTIKPNSSIKKNTAMHNDLLFGRKFYPKMVGYCVGYYLVRKKLKDSNKGVKDLMLVPSEDIIY